MVADPCCQSALIPVGERKDFEVYSCDVSPDGSRLVTAAGGEQVMNMCPFLILPLVPSIPLRFSHLLAPANRCNAYYRPTSAIHAQFLTMICALGANIEYRWTRSDLVDGGYLQRRRPCLRQQAAATCIHEQPFWY